MYSGLNNLERLICHKTQTNEQTHILKACVETTQNSMLTVLAFFRYRNAIHWGKKDT